MASLVPSNIGSSLSSLSQGITDVFQNVSDTVQTVNSVYAQLTGQAESAPVQTASPQGTVDINPVKLASTDQQMPTLRSNNTMLTVGAAVLVGVGVLLILK